MSKKLTTIEFIEKAKQIHNNKYNYDKVVYKGRHKKVCIICPIHGEFWQECGSHLSGKGCPICNSSNKLSTEDFINKSKQIHGDKYDYSKVNYINSRTKVCIICKEHGEFWQIPSTHLRGIGCSKCSKKYKPTLKEFIEKSQKIHGNKYDYSKVKYINSHTKVCIICPIHGEFWQKPNKHLLGQGCPNCNNYKLEKEIESFLNKNDIKYERNLFYKQINSLQLDFYIPKYNIAIECQGIQHFEPVDYFGGEKQFEIQTKNDKIKRQLCEENGIKLIYYSNLGIDYPYKVYEKLDELKLIIKTEKEK